MDLSGNRAGSLQQTVAGFTPGASYVFKFEYALHISAKEARSANVLIDGEIVDTISANTGALVPNYQSVEFPFVAPASGSITFGFQSLSSDSRGVVIDNLRIENGPATLPQIVNASFEQPVVNTWALVTGGVGALPGWTITSAFAEIDRTPWPCLLYTSDAADE